VQYTYWEKEEGSRGGEVMDTEEESGNRVAKTDLSDFLSQSAIKSSPGVARKPHVVMFSILEEARKELKERCGNNDVPVIKELGMACKKIGMV
jgi:hypothetical protein